MVELMVLSGFDRVCGVCVCVWWWWWGGLTLRAGRAGMGTQTLCMAPLTRGQGGSRRNHDCVRTAHILGCDAQVGVLGQGSC